MTKFVIAITAVAFTTVAMPLVAPSPAAAEIIYPWCAEYSLHGSSPMNCGFVTREQCMATISGIGGSCMKNLRYPDRAERTTRKPKRKKYR
jgi:hypothetical protein